MSPLLPRPVLSLWRHLWLIAWPVAVIELMSFIMVMIDDSPRRSTFPLIHSIAFLLIALMVGFEGYLYKWWVWKFAFQVWRFRTVMNRKVVLHYPPETPDAFDPSHALQRCTVELDCVSRRFGSILPYRVAVFVFPLELYPNEKDDWKTGMAWSGIVILKTGYVGEDAVLRHEYAHLFGFRWNRDLASPPTLLSEGLCVWAQVPAAARLDEYASNLLSVPELTIGNMLSPEFFHGERERDCYVLAGSFVGFLIRRHGLDRLRRLYRHCNRVRFEAKFRRCYGVSLEEAEMMWRKELLSKVEMNVGDSAERR